MTQACRPRAVMAVVELYIPKVPKKFRDQVFKLRYKHTECLYCFPIAVHSQIFNVKLIPSSIYKFITIRHFTTKEHDMTLVPQCRLALLRQNVHTLSVI